KANRTLGGGRARQALEKDYRAFVTSASARAAYKKLVTELARRAGGPLPFHCTAGKYRTGGGVTLIPLLLRPDEPTAPDEYLAVRPALRVALATQVAAFTGG
ncbi:tyrosine-protein phosphatase, partial [Saccharothrix sp. ST-888]|uniref:tyrosine-protein phosphatase n=1 Tax=Saccharothrix sp. ST-888 TaxID=1427391 RepID=UPI0005EBF450